MVSIMNKELNECWKTSEGCRKSLRKGEIEVDEFIEKFLADRKMYHRLNMQIEVLKAAPASAN